MEEKADLSDFVRHLFDNTLYVKTSGVFVEIAVRANFCIIDFCRWKASYDSSNWVWTNALSGEDSCLAADSFPKIFWYNKHRFSISYVPHFGIGDALKKILKRDSISLMRISHFKSVFRRSKGNESKLGNIHGFA